MSTFAYMKAIKNQGKILAGAYMDYLQETEKYIVRADGYLKNLLFLQILLLYWIH